MTRAGLVSIVAVNQQRAVDAYDTRCSREKVESILREVLEVEGLPLEAKEKVQKALDACEAIE